jgi:hypothetical protein
MQQWWNDADRGKPKFPEKKPVAIPLFPPQIPHRFTENTAGSLPEECTMKCVSGASEDTKITLLLVPMHTAPITYNRCAVRHRMYGD